MDKIENEYCGDCVMITDDTVRKFFLDCEDYFQNYLENYRELDSIIKLRVNFWRGTLGEKFSPNYCKRDKLVFSIFKIIPRHCFNCFKIQIEPRNVMELFKLMIIFQNHLPLANDNPRKCFVEARPKFRGTYKGFIYSRDLHEAKEIMQNTKRIISSEVASGVPVVLKRGCSEFSQSYPEFEKIDENCNTLLEYKEEWQQLEEFADTTHLNVQYVPHRVHRNSRGWPFEDVVTMLTWLKYAATIGDETYRDISPKPITPFQDIDRSRFDTE